MDLICKKCNLDMKEKQLFTAMEYDKDIKYIIPKTGIPDLEMLPKFIIFACPKCNSKKKLSFEKYFELKQLLILELILDIRLRTSMQLLDRADIKEESGHVYCGVCAGPYDGDGYCNKDVIDKCLVRGEILGK